MGSVLGGILSLTNLYIGLKTGWGIGVAITACILSYAIWTTLYRLGLARTRMTILENNCMQSTASAAGYSTGGTLVSAIAAYILINGHSLPTLTLMAWVFFLAVLGVTMAIPMKRQMINIEQLRFPSGVAAAETLRALHSTGGGGMKAAKALGLAGLLSALNNFWCDGLHLISEKLAPFALAEILSRVNLAALGTNWVGRTVSFVWDPIFIAAGAITGLRISASMLVGGVLCWVIFVPLLQHYMAQGGTIIGSQYKELINWTLWGGASCMVTAGLLSFALQWRSALRAFAGFGQMIFLGAAEATTLTADRDACLLVCNRPTGRPNRSGLTGHDEFRRSCLDYGGGRPAVVRPGARRLPRHGRNRHHAGGCDGPDHAAHLRGHSPRQRERHVDDGVCHGRGGGLIQRLAD